DANALTLNFTADPGTQSIMFDFIFGIEQYTEFIGAFRNDAFSAYLDGIPIMFDGNGKSPSLDNVSVDNLANQFLIEYDGMTAHVRTRAPLNLLNSTHTLKFVIVDGDLGDFDSGV